jgi:hypothetical protein
VSYVDILGFADLIGKSRTDASQVGKIANLLSTLKERSSGWSRIHRTSSGEPESIFSSFDFSDHIVRCTRVAAGANVFELLESELFFLGDLQLSVAERGALVRGSVSEGEVFFNINSSLIFGPALVRAYELERNHAVYPRIIVDRNLIAEAREVGDHLNWRNYLLQGEDGVDFLDYLFDWSQTGFTIPDAPDPKARIRAHRTMIIGGIGEKPNERAMRKLMWLGRYHNSTIRRLMVPFGNQFLADDLSKYLIPDELLSF